MGHKKICFYVKMCVRVEKSLNSIIDDVEKKTRLYRPHTLNNKKKSYIKPHTIEVKLHIIMLVSF